MTLAVACPAKINWFLSVGPKDAAGYHPLRTVFQAIGLYDELRVTEGVGESSFECDWADMPADNTLTKTLRLAAELTDIPPMRIELKKRIPAQSGLGGGSSDAAGLIRLLASLTRGRLSGRDQIEIAKAVGADVPFFLMGGMARGEGYGDKLTPLEDRPETWLVVARPNLGCDTRAMYAKLDAVDREWLEFPDCDRCHNDFEAVAPIECLAILANLRCLGAASVGLCGSGSAVFGVFENRSEADLAARNLNRGAAWPMVWSVPTIGRAASLKVDRVG